MGPGTLVSNRYEIDALIGRGGMGRVFRATDRETRATVAVKVLHHDDAQEEQIRADRFRREIAILAGINHPAVPTVIAWGEHDGALYFVSELVDGVPLRKETERRGSWRPSDAAALAAQVADALAAAHALGIVHRDVNANNIMIERDQRVRLLDFGIARANAVDMTRLTTTGTIMGTPGYMSPEQFEAGVVSERSDVYSLGVVLFELLTGRLPFTGQTPMAVAIQHKTEPPPAVRALRPDVPDWMDRVVMRCLEKDPARRFPNGAALARELARTARRGSARRRRLPSGDIVTEDCTEHADHALVLAAVQPRAGWKEGMALRFEDRYYRLQSVGSPAGADGRWTYYFAVWPEEEIFRGVVDYEQDTAAQAEAALSLPRRIARLFSRS